MRSKSGFFTFCFGLVPGMGQMYLGYMKRGVSLMLMFCGIIFVSALLNIGLLCIVLPVIWAYALFDALNLRTQTPEQAEANPDDFMFDPESLMGRNWSEFISRRHSLFGWGLIFIGFYSLYRTFVRPLLWDLYNRFNLMWLRSLLDDVPTIVVAVLLIGLGLYLVKGPSKPESRPEALAEDYTAFRGEGDGQNV